VKGKRARGCRSRRTTRINHAGRELFLATSSFNSAEGVRPDPRAAGIPARNSSAIGIHPILIMIHGEISLDVASLSPSRTHAHLPREIKRADPQSPPHFRAGRVLPSKRDYISLQCALSILSYILQRASGAETWARPLIGSVSERTVSGQRTTSLSLFLFAVCPLPDGRTDGRTGSRAAITILSSLICEHSARISLLHGALCAAGRGRCTY